MKKRVLAIVLGMAMTVGMVTGCSTEKDSFLAALYQ